VNEECYLLKEGDTFPSQLRKTGEAYLRVELAFFSVVDTETDIHIAVHENIAGGVTLECEATSVVIQRRG
jgi:hypothetical protein